MEKFNKKNLFLNIKKYNCLLNFSSHTVFYKGMSWKTAAHAFQGQKFDDYENKMAVFFAETPYAATLIGSEKKRPLRKDWEKIKDDILKEILTAKVFQHGVVREVLLSTNKAFLVCQNENDHYWSNGGDGSGKNIFGKILMEIRDELVKDGPFDELKNTFLPLWQKYPELERYSMGWRMGSGEKYSIDWEIWYKGLTKKGKLKYQQIYPEPPSWKGFYKKL